MMIDKRIGIRELKNNASRILRAVREEMAEYVVTHHGEPVAILRPINENDKKEQRRLEIETAMAELDILAKQVAENWVSDKTVVALVAEQRRF